MMSYSAASKVLIRNENGGEWELNGEPETNFGQHIFIETIDTP